MNVGRIKFQSGGAFEYMVKTDPYPWKEIGVREEIRVGNSSYPSGGSECINVYSGSSEFTVPPQINTLNFCLGGGVEVTVKEPIVRFENSGEKIYFRMAEREEQARGPLEIEKIDFQICSTVGAVFNRDNIGLEKPSQCASNGTQSEG